MLLYLASFGERYRPSGAKNEETTYLVFSELKIGSKVAIEPYVINLRGRRLNIGIDFVSFWF